ncbi:hypothetical protein KZX45_07620 [Georgenia sp. EYE_87]|uniref:hypothetical protein n=1 Tax=Georgenia sp. EYE_87 TaxID=2853448 RepID=UPI002003592E|nr:hypothetical protein [Georgenia sp. EYE_87]MCK6210407.1 hypothetical protein [Georgenia sp. EYE_87]
MRPRSVWLPPLAVALLLALGGCSDDEPVNEAGQTRTTAETERETEGGDVAYDGPYDSAFYQTIAEYDGEEVTVIGRVDEVVSPTSFTMAGTEDTEVGPLLIVDVGAVGGFEPDMVVAVSGIVHEAFDLETVEQRFNTDLDDELHEEWNGGPYIEAVTIGMPDTSA